MISEDWLFLLLAELIPKLTTCPYFFGVEIVESTYRAGFTSGPQALLWSHATLGLPGHQDWRRMSVAVTKCPWLDLTRPVFKKHMPQELYEKNLSRTWQDLDSCMDQSSGPRDNYIGAYFSARGSPKVVAHSQNLFMFPYGQNGNLFSEFWA